MLLEFQAIPALRSNRIDLSWTWRSNQLPLLRCVRRRQSEPTGPTDGEIAIDMADLSDGTTPWQRIERIRYLIPGLRQAEDPNLAELAVHYRVHYDERSGVRTITGGLLQAELAVYYGPVAEGEADRPTQVQVTVYDVGNGKNVLAQFDEVTRVEQSSDHKPTEPIRIFGQQETLLGQLIRSPVDGESGPANVVSWQPAAGPRLDALFDRIEHEVTKSRIRMEEGVSVLEFETLRNRELVSRLQVDEIYEPSDGQLRQRVSLQDMGLEPETTYHYTLFQTGDPDSGEPPVARTIATTTGEFDFGDTLYQLLPALHRRFDEPSQGGSGDGQLHSYLQIFGAALNQTRSLAEGLRARHDVASARADLLLPLARTVGWQPDMRASVQLQRMDIGFAPELYRSAGTIPNLCAVFNRMTERDCRVKEFGRNVFVTNAPEPIAVWDIWSGTYDGEANAAAPVTDIGEGLDGRPAAVLLPNNQGLWLFWHSARGGIREIWCQQMDSVDTSPQRVIAGAVDDPVGVVPTVFADENPAVVEEETGVHLFWSSDCGGGWDIWQRTWQRTDDGFSTGPPLQLTEPGADDRNSAAVMDSEGQLWLFWQSNRRGRHEIWAQIHDGSRWEQPQRITSVRADESTPGNHFGHTLPAAVLHDDGIWLFWVADLGDRQNLCFQVLSPLNNGAWTEPQAVTQGRWRDEAPSAVSWDGQLRLFWCSNRGGRFQLWRADHDGSGWREPVVVGRHSGPDKEPAAVVDKDDVLRLFWRSQRGGVPYRSRTYDARRDGTEGEVAAHQGAFDDRFHYTFGTRGRQDGREVRFASDAIGVFVTPDPTSNDQSTQIDRAAVRSFLRDFLPLNVQTLFYPHVSPEE